MEIQEAKREIESIIVTSPNAEVSIESSVICGDVHFAFVAQLDYDDEPFSVSGTYEDIKHIVDTFHRYEGSGLPPHKFDFHKAFIEEKKTA